MKAVYSFAQMKDIVEKCGFTVNESLGAREMTKQYFSEYNINNSEHPMTAPTGVSYIFAIKQ